MAKTKKKIPKWMKPLTAKERKHIMETSGTLRALKNVVAWHEEQRKLRPDYEPCWECKMIARKLNLLEKRGEK